MQPLIDIIQLSEILNTPVSTIYGWRCSNKIPYIKLGKRALFSLEDIINFINKNRVPAKG